MSNFTIVNSRNEATIKSERDLWRYACNLKRISINDSKAKIYSGVNITVQQANEVLDFIDENEADSIAYELEQKGFKDKEINKMLKNTIQRKWKKVCNFKKIDLEVGCLEEERDYLERIDKTLSILDGKMRISKPISLEVKAQVDEQGSCGSYTHSEKKVSVRTGSHFIITLAHELAHAYDYEITPEFAIGNSVFWNIDKIEVQPYLGDIDCFDDEAINEAMDKAQKQREKFFKDLNKRNVLDFNNDKFEKLERQKALAKDLYDVLAQHPVHIAGKGEYYTADDKKEFFARAVELVVKDELLKSMDFAHCSDITLERMPVVKKHEREILRLEKTLKDETMLMCDAMFKDKDTSTEGLKQHRKELEDKVKLLKRQYFAVGSLTQEQKNSWHNAIVPKTNALLTELLEQRKGLIEKGMDKLKKAI